MIATPHAHGRAMRILLVEDNYGDVLLTQQVFSKASFPYTLQVVNDGEAAVHALQPEGSHAAQELPDLVLLDINLPKMNGTEVLGVIRSNSWLSHLPVIMLTSSRAEQDVVRTYELNVNGYLIKPIELDMFMSAIRTIGSLQALLTPRAE